MRTFFLVATSAVLLAAVAYVLAPGAASAQSAGGADAGATPDGGAEEAAPPVADLDPERALLARAAHAYDEGRFDDALRELDEGYRLYAKPSYLFNLGQVHRQRKSCDAALAAYDKFLAVAPASDEHRAVAILHQTEMKRCATPAVIPVAVPLAVVEKAAPHATPGSDERRWMKPTGLAVLGGALLSAGVATYFAVESRSISNELSHNPGTRARFDQGESAQTKAIVFSAGAAALAGAGVALLYMAPAVTVTPAPAAASLAAPLTSAMVNWSGRF